MNKKNILSFIIIPLFIMTLLGIPSLITRISSGHLHTGYGQIVTWGLWVATYVFLIGISAGAFLISTLSLVFGVKKYASLAPLSLFLALISLMASLIFIVADLGHPGRMLSVLFTPNFSSVMVWIVWLYIIYTIILALELWIILRPRLAVMSGGKGGLLRRISGGYSPSEGNKKRDALFLKILGTIGIFVAVCFHGGVGALFAVMGGKPFWHTGLLPITFVISALLSGGALVVCIAVLLFRGGYHFRDMIISLGRLVGYLLIIELVALFSELLVTVKGAVPSHVEVIRIMLSGSFAWVFWGLQVVLGCLIPLIILFGKRKPILRDAAIASLLILIGVFAFRLNIVIPQQAAEPALKGITSAYISHRISSHYIPTFMEWSFLFFGIGLSSLVFFLGYFLLPLAPAGRKTMALDFKSACPAGDQIFLKKAYD